MSGRILKVQAYPLNSPYSCRPLHSQEGLYSLLPSLRSTLCVVRSTDSGVSFKSKSRSACLKHSEEQLLFMLLSLQHRGVVPNCKMNKLRSVPHFVLFLFLLSYTFFSTSLSSFNLSCSKRSLVCFWLFSPEVTTW